MDNSARLSLPYLLPSQAQKHVTHNTALERLDLLVQLVVEAFDATTPPTLPQEGQIWALGVGATGVWAGQDNTLAAFVGEAWQFIEASPGWVASETTTGTLRVRGAAGWTPLSLSDLDNLGGVGIGTSHDATNRLAVAGDATLLTHGGAGHQLKLNKATAGDTASLLFQTGWSGRAEMGTAGSDDFAIKVSADGSQFQNGAVFDAATGAVDFPGGASIAGQTAYHAGNVMGTVSQAGGVPTGAVIEHGSNTNGRYTRFADGTQICWVADIDMGSIVVGGLGTWADPYRTNAVNLIWAMPFVGSPAVSTTLAPKTIGTPLEARAMTVNPFEAPDATGWDYVRASRLGGSSYDFDVLLSVMAIGRWF